MSTSAPTPPPKFVKTGTKTACKSPTCTQEVPTVRVVFLDGSTDVTCHFCPRCDGLTPKP